MNLSLLATISLSLLMGFQGDAGDTETGVGLVQGAPGATRDLEFHAGPIRFYSSPTSGEAYWYMTYEVVNRGKSNEIWAPRFELLEDGGRVLRSGRDVPPEIREELLQLVQPRSADGNAKIEDQFSVLGPIMPGDSGAKNGVVIWIAGHPDPAQHLRTSSLTLFIRGISRETTVVNDPLTGKPVTLYRQLHREYSVPGDHTLRGTNAARLVSQEWIDR